MKSLMLNSVVGLAALCLTLSLSQHLFAAPSYSGGLLIQAYATLEMADHDYKGHRVAAMKQIEAAGKLVSVNIHGDGKVHEKQGVSDEQLRAAQGLLEQARAGLGGKALAHVNRAINQLSIALKIK